MKRVEEKGIYETLNMYNFCIINIVVMVVAAASILLPLKVKGKAQAVEAHRVERR
jgi:hypothetical protein